MTTSRQFSEIEGGFTQKQENDRPCPKCKAPMTWQNWESSDGAYEDSKYTCSNRECGHVYWIDGIDS